MCCEDAIRRANWAMNGIKKQTPLTIIVDFIGLHSDLDLSYLVTHLVALNKNPITFLHQRLSSV
jgi:hypothetical protein